MPNTNTSTMLAALSKQANELFTSFGQRSASLQTMNEGLKKRDWQVQENKMMAAVLVNVIDSLGALYDGMISLKQLESKAQAMLAGQMAEQRNEHVEALRETVRAEAAKVTQEMGVDQASAPVVEPVVMNGHAAKAPEVVQADPAVSAPVAKDGWDMLTEASKPTTPVSEAVAANDSTVPIAAVPVPTSEPVAAVPASMANVPSETPHPAELTGAEGNKGQGQGKHNRRVVK